MSLQDQLAVYSSGRTYRSFGFVNSIHGTSLSTAFASDTIHGGIRRVCNKITGHVIAIENFMRTSFHVDAHPPRTLSHIHTRARKSLHIRTRLHIHTRLSRNSTEDKHAKFNGKNGKTTDDRALTRINEGNVPKADKVDTDCLCCLY